VKKRGFESNPASLVPFKFHSLIPGRYVGIPDEEDDGIPFEVNMKPLTGQLKEQMEEAQTLDIEIKKQLSKIGLIYDKKVG
jgi:type I restriction enzyme M protein